MSSTITLIQSHCNYCILWYSIQRKLKKHQLNLQCGFDRECSDKWKAINFDVVFINTPVVVVVDVVVIVVFDDVSLHDCHVTHRIPLIVEAGTVLSSRNMKASFGNDIGKFIRFVFFCKNSQKLLLNCCNSHQSNLILSGQPDIHLVTNLLTRTLGGHYTRSRVQFGLEAWSLRNKFDHFLLFRVISKSVMFHSTFRILVWT